MSSQDREANRLSASKLHLLKHCKAFVRQRWIAEPTSEYAKTGTEAHDYYETGIENDDTFTLVPRFLRPEERGALDVKHEPRVAYNVRTGAIDFVGKGASQRDYEQWQAEEWICGSVDASWEENGILVVEDLKTGAPVEAECDQLVFLGGCIAGATAAQTGSPPPLVVLQTLNATRYGYKTKPKQAGVVSMDSVTLRYEELMERFAPLVAEAKSAMGEDHPPVYGRHCWTCPAKSACEAYRAKQNPQRIAYLDKLIESQDARGAVPGEDAPPGEGE